MLFTDKGRDVLNRGRVVAEVAGEDVILTVPTMVPAGTPAAHLFTRLALLATIYQGAWSNPSH